MNKRNKIIIAGAAVLAIAAGGVGVATATSGGGEDQAEGPDTPITGSAVNDAESAALAHTGEGTVTETEVGDEESRYEVEVTLDDGSQTDVQLDGDLNVVGEESDGTESGEEDEAGDQ